MLSHLAMPDGRVVHTRDESPSLFPSFARRLLSGKLHVSMGNADTFYLNGLNGLNGATVLPKESLEKLGCDAFVEISPGKDYRGLITPELRGRIRREIMAAFLAAFPKYDGKSAPSADK